MNFDLKSASTFRPSDPQKDDDFIEDEQQQEEEFEEEIEYEEESNLNAGEVLYSWKAPEFEVYDKSPRWYLVGAIFILAMVSYALYTNGPIMAITFILIGIVGYIHVQKDPRIITFAITTKGVLADKQLYLYENIFSFWIFYEKHHKRIISLHTKASMLPFVHIPIEDEDPVKLRELLLQSIPEIKQDHSLIDTLERVLHI